MNINEYIPSNGVEVLFRLVTNTIETVNVDLGRLLKYLINQNLQVLVNDDGEKKLKTNSYWQTNHCIFVS